MDQRASDIHIEPEEQVFHVRMRIDGILHTRMTLPASRYPAVASRVKLISGMDIAERRLPQDGRLGTRVSGGGWMCVHPRSRRCTGNRSCCACCPRSDRT